MIRREKECDKRDNLLARRQERIQHINGEAVLSETVDVSFDTTLDLYNSEGGMLTLTWENKHRFASRTLAYTITLESKRAKAEAAAEVAARDAKILALGAALLEAGIPGGTAPFAVQTNQHAIVSARRMLSR